MAIDYTVIGSRIKSARKVKNLTQEKLAEQLNVSVAFLSRIERGSSHINLHRLTQICSILEVTEGEILNGVSCNSPQYLNSEFAVLLKNTTTKKRKLIYDIAKVIVETK